MKRHRLRMCFTMVLEEGLRGGVVRDFAGPRTRALKLQHVVMTYTGASCWGSSS